MKKNSISSRSSKETLTRISHEHGVFSPEKILYFQVLAREILTIIPAEELDWAERELRGIGNEEKLADLVRKTAEQLILCPLDPNFATANLGLNQDQKRRVARTIEFENEQLFEQCTPILQELFKQLASK